MTFKKRLKLKQNFASKIKGLWCWIEHPLVMKMGTANKLSKTFFENILLKFVSLNMSNDSRIKSRKIK